MDDTPHNEFPETSTRHLSERYARAMAAPATPEDLVNEIEARMRHPLLAERELTHGDFNNTARTAQSLKYVVRAGKNWSELTMVQQETLDAICIKIARILSGDPNHPDHWCDIEGQAHLVTETLS